MTPPRTVIACPDAAVTVHSYKWSTRNKKDWLFAIWRKIFCGGARHIKAVQIMNFVVAYNCSTVFFRVRKIPAERSRNAVIKTFVVFNAVLNAKNGIFHTPGNNRIVSVSFFCKFGQRVCGALYSVLRIKKRRLVHIVPKTVDSAVKEDGILFSEPSAHVGIKKIREMRKSWPHSRAEQGTVFFTAEHIFLYAFLIYGIAFVRFYSCINNRHKMNAVFLKGWNSFFQIRDFLWIHRKITKSVHIVNVKEDCVKRNVKRTVIIKNVFYVLLTAVPPAALHITKRPVRRNIACTDYIPESRNNVLYSAVLFFYIIKRNVSLSAGKWKNVFFCTAGINYKISRIVGIKTETFMRRRRIDDKKIMRTVQRFFFFGMARVVIAPASVYSSAFIYSAHCLAKTKNHIVISKRN